MPVTKALMPEINGPRSAVRSKVIRHFLLEDPGSGTKDLASKYIYTAETLPSGKHILLKRPAFLNKGMDFTVHVDSHYFRTRGGSRDMPTHSDIAEDLITKKANSAKVYKKISQLLNAIYQCEPVSVQDCISVPYVPRKNSNELSVVEVLMAAKWLFIEQDVTYWNYSGRNMLYSYLHEEGLC